MNDTADFGSFTHSFLTSFRDEYVKLPCITFPFLSHRSPQQGDALDVRPLELPKPFTGLTIGKNIYFNL